ncbi:MAG TPA: hypothetical protein VHD91_11795 [Gaiellaceae bacterium]|nr:hypothetical protein [Gaiellaceae bacterium]
MSVVFVTGLLLVMLGIGPLPAERLVAIYVLLVAAIVLSSLTRMAQAADKDPLAYSQFEAKLRERGERPGRPPELIRTERELTLGSASAGQLHQRLLPLLRDAAAARLLSKHDADLSRRSDAARRLLGDRAWELLRPDRPAPADRNAPGLSLSEIGDVVTRIEAL